MLLVPASLDSAHQVAQHCHSEPFDRLRTGSAKNEARCHPESRLGGAKDLEILRRPASCGTPQNDKRRREVRMDTNLFIW